MKTLMVTTFILIAIIVIMVATYKAPPTTDVSVLRDITDKHLSQPKSAELFTLYDFTGEHKWNGASLRFSNLTDVSYNHTSEIAIGNANQWFSNEPEREKTILKFQNDASKIITDAAKDSIGREHSAVYLPIAMELTRLSQSKAERRILIIYSDLMENDLDVSLYNGNELQLLATHPDSLKEIFEKRKALTSLVGIEVYLIYQPEYPEADKEYRLVSELYKNLLESKGAIVHIAANLSN